jgi:drug/metabolite transporter (DMT)-like permease
MAFGQSVYFKATSVLGPKKASSYILMVPVTAVLFSIILLGESINHFTILGGSLSLLAILILNKNYN